MTEKFCDIAVIGGGPAGFSAAAIAAEGGASVLLVDNAPTLGGHFYKSLPDSFNGKYTAIDRVNIQEFQTRANRLESSQAEIIDQAEVWGIFQESKKCSQDDVLAAKSVENHPFSIYAQHPKDQNISIHAKLIILAPGVYDRPLPFPGWELPGVMTPGAVQMMLKKQGLLPGKRILVCGTGPLQMVVAASLVEEGAEVVSLLDTSGIFDGMSYLPGALGGLPSRLREALHSARILASKRVPILFQHAVFRALGNTEKGVDGAIIGKINANGNPIPGTEKKIAVDSICCAYGFIPSIALTLHLDCEHFFDPNLCANVPWHNERMQTSLPGVMIAGDITGVGGKPLADLQGTLAGISALEELNLLTDEEAKQRRNKLAGAVRREVRFSRWLWHRYRIRKGLLDLTDDDTLICRCENVKMGDIRRSLEEGARDLYGVKLRTRMGMGSCQGRYCMMNAAMLISNHTGYPVDELGIQSVRPPISPIKLKHIANK